MHMCIINYEEVAISTHDTAGFSELFSCASNFF